MKRWKVTFGLFLLLFALATTVACAETKEAKMDWNDRTVIFAQPGETIHFTYDVPEDYVVTKEEWLWYFCYTNGRSATLYDGEYGESHMESYTMSQRESMSNGMEKAAFHCLPMKWCVFNCT